MLFLRSQGRGALLIEILLGMSLLMIAVMAVFALFPVGDRAILSADRSTQAHQLARRMLEAQMGKSYSELEPGISSGVETFEHSRRGGVPLSTTFHFRTEIAQPDLTQQLKKITVTVTWERGSQDPKSAPPVILESIKGEVL